MTVVIECDLRHLFGPIRDQGERPTCMAFAASDAHAAARRGSWEALSCEYAYFHALKQDRSCRRGGVTLKGTLSAIRDDGQPPEAKCSYLYKEPANVSQWQPPSDVKPIYRCDSEYWGASAAAIRRQLDSGVPVITTMCLSAGFFVPGVGGIIAANEPPDTHLRHAVIAVGHGNRNGKRFILVRNSWGPDWGLDGYAWVSEAYLEPRLHLMAEMKEDLTNVPPNPDAENLRSGVA